MANSFIRKLQGYGDLTAAEVATLTAATATPRRLPARRDLIREGDRPGPVFVVLEGWACRYKILPGGGRQVLALMMPGDCCDLHAGLLAEMDHSIQTVTPALVATIDHDAMDAIMKIHRGIAKTMYVAQLVNEGTMRAWITSLGRRASIERVAHLMCELYIRAHSVGLTIHQPVSLPISQLLLVDSLGITAVHLNRVLRALRLEGAMALSRGILRVENIMKLVQIAGLDENYLHRRLRAVR